MRLDDDSHARALAVLAEFVESAADPIERHPFILARDELIREHANVRSLQLMSEIDEAASLVHMLGALDRIGFVHLG